jgi:hypothetical protein
MQMSDANELMEATSVAVANNMLKDGWKLLAVCPASFSDGSSSPIYILGKTKPGHLTTGPLPMAGTARMR